MRTWGIPEVRNDKVPWGNDDAEDTDSVVPQLGSQAYQAGGSNGRPMVKLSNRPGGRTACRLANA